ncbi:hypothetical protein [Raineyella sp. LH-20]|uniref:hypothetical protein n=1 Tax=Raineyella sp. LH-20 TaxID=3081204 RepID=UPI00295526C2|nr:hypothetical protein [Raineyella sp. LH-20]WOP18819.1 hypothetical protein R0146_00665 [Raineyella sp. LH-20]
MPQVGYRDVVDAPEVSHSVGQICRRRLKAELIERSLDSCPTRQAAGRLPAQQ